MSSNRHQHQNLLNHFSLLLIQGEHPTCCHKWPSKNQLIFGDRLNKIGRQKTAKSLSVSLVTSTVDQHMCLEIECAGWGGFDRFWDRKRDKVYKMNFLSAIFFIFVVTNVVSSDCPTKKTQSKLICYYSKLTQVDSCKCSHVILPADSDVKSIDRFREHAKGVKILITVNEFNQVIFRIRGSYCYCIL